MVCVQACGSSTLNSATLGSLQAVVGGLTALVTGSQRLNTAKRAFKSVVIYANDFVTIQSMQGLSALGQKNIMYKLGEIADYITTVAIQSNWPALVACEANAKAGLEYSSSRRYAVLPASPLVSGNAEELFFSRLGNPSATTATDRIKSGVTQFLLRTSGSYNVKGLGDLDLDVSKRPPLAWFCNYRAWAMVECALLTFNNIKVDVVTRDSMFVVDSLYSPVGQLGKYSVGGYDDIDDLINASQRSQCYFTILPFFFTRKYAGYGGALCASSMLYTPLNVNLSLYPIDQLIVVSRENVVVKTVVRGEAPRNDDVQINLVAELSQVEPALRDLLSVAPYTQVYVYTNTIYYRSNFSDLRLDVKNAGKLLVFAGRRDSVTAAAEYFNYTGLAGQQLLLSVTVSYTSVIRFNAVSNALLSGVGAQSGNQLNQFYIDDNPYLILFFTLDPQNPSYAGATSFDAYQIITANLVVQDSAEALGMIAVLITQSYNFIDFGEATGQALYSF